MYCRHHFSSRLAVESLFSEQQGHRCCSSASLWACTAVSAMGKAHLHCPQVQQICSGMESQKHLSKRHCFMLLELPKLTRAQLIVFLGPQASQSIILAWEHIPWAAARLCSWGDGFLRVTDPLASTQLWAQGCWHTSWLALVEGCPRTAH